MIGTIIALIIAIVVGVCVVCWYVCEVERRERLRKEKLRHVRAMAVRDYEKAMKNGDEDQIEFTRGLIKALDFVSNQIL